MQLTASKNCMTAIPGRSALASPEVHPSRERELVRVRTREVLTRRAATIAAAVATPLVDHYNTTRKNCTKGAGFHQCGGNEDERQAQMDALAKE